MFPKCWRWSNSPSRDRFDPRTIELGTYIGLRLSGRLVAMAGERLWIDDLPRGQRRVHASRRSEDAGTRRR